MSLSKCTKCQTVEGAWRFATADELKQHGYEEDEDLEVCLECGGVGTDKSVPEPDDFIFER